MREEDSYNTATLEMFGLTYEQSNLLFSTERMITKFDIALTHNREKAKIKAEWLKKWESGIKTYLNNVGSDGEIIEEKDLLVRFKSELQKSNNRTWYYILVLECLVFIPYTALSDGDEKKYKECKYDSKNGYLWLKNFFLKHGVLSEEKIESLHKTYKKSIDRINGKAEKVALEIVAVAAIGGIGAAVAATLAGPIAVALFGAQFAGLSGASLTAACLAMVGGGAIAVGGSGMAGGIMVIAGGGALLGLAGSGTAAGITAAMVQSAPKYTLTQAAKLETILKEVILNAQQDVALAQKIISQLQQQIEEVNKKLIKLEIDDEKNKKEINNIKISVKYLTRSCKNMSVFTSAYETGLRVETK